MEEVFGSSTTAFFETKKSLMALIAEGKLRKLTERERNHEASLALSRNQQRIGSRKKVRTREDNIREYEDDKWGPLLRRIQPLKAPNVLDMDLQALGYGEGIGSFQDVSYKGSLLDIHGIYAAAVAEYVSGICAGSPVVDIGAGYGSIAARVMDLVDAPNFIFLDISRSGQTCIRLLTQFHPLVTIGACDFESDPFTDQFIPSGATVFTSMALTVLPNTPSQFIRALLHLHPRQVVHFEPVPIRNPTSELDRARNAYIKINGYNDDILECLRIFEGRGELKIVHVWPNQVATNQLLSGTLIHWVPGG